MLNVFLTVDVEMWCGWERMDERFPDAFRRYVYGPTPHGDYGLPMTLRLLSEHGLHGVFFTEALFASRFGIAPLSEIVGLVRTAGQEVQLHAHPEWADEANEPILAGHHVKKAELRAYSLAEQTALISAAKRLLQRAGADESRAFRAGGFSMGRDTPAAVAASGLAYDLSYDAALIAPADSPVGRGMLLQPQRVGGVVEYPMTVFRDVGRRLRHLQVGATAFEEIEAILWHALEHRWNAVVILSHNFELLNQRKDAPDRIVVSRFRRLCALLDKHRDAFRTSGFPSAAEPANGVADVPAVPLLATARRYAEQALRRLHS